MFLHYGRKRTTKRLGQVADYCLMCHSRRAFKLYRVSESSHLYQIPVVESSLLGYERICAVCGQSSSAQIDDYSAISRKGRTDLDSLIALTNPNLKSGLEAELEANARIQGGTGSQEDRMALLAGPFHLVHPGIKARHMTTHLDFRSALSILMTLGALVLCSHFQIERDSRLNVALAAACILFMISCALLVTDTGRYVRKTARPRLVYALSPFVPTLEELQTLAETDREKDCEVDRSGKAHRFDRRI